MYTYSQPSSAQSASPVNNINSKPPPPRGTRHTHISIVRACVDRQRPRSRSCWWFKRRSNCTLNQMQSIHDVIHSSSCEYVYHTSCCSSVLCRRGSSTYTTCDDARLSTQSLLVRMSCELFARVQHAAHHTGRPHCDHDHDIGHTRDRGCAPCALRAAAYNCAQ